MSILIDILEKDVISDILLKEEIEPCAREINIEDKYLKIKNKLGEFITSDDRKLARDNLDIKASTIPYKISDYEDIESVKDALDKLLKKPFKLLNFNVSPLIYDAGTYLNNLNINWQFNKEPKTTQLYINNELLKITNSDSVTINKLFKGNVSVLLKGFLDDEVVSKTINIKAVNPLYFGINKDYSLNTKVLTDSNTGKVDVDAGDSNYIYMITPFEVTPIVNGFEGGFLKLDDIQITTQIGSILTYNVYRSDFSGLGKTTILWRLK